MAEQFGNGVADAAAAAAVANESDEVLMPRITSALDLIYNRQSTNQARQEAQQYLEIVKDAVQAPSIGFALASDPSSPAVVRHFGLSMLEHAIKHKWDLFSGEQVIWIRRWVLELTEKVSRADASFLRSKVGLLWVEVAKRCWADDWLDMDEQLLSLWQAVGPGGDNVRKELVLYILETLSDEVFNGDDAAVAMREGVLRKSCVDIFTPLPVLNECFPNRVTTPNVRAGDEGWLLRVTELLNVCNAADVQANDDARSCAVRSLAVLTSLLPWINPKAVIACQCVSTLYKSLAAPHVTIQKAALEALHALYSHNQFFDVEFVELVVPTYDAKQVDLYYRLFEWSKVDVDDIDDDKYQFAKKFSEMLSCLGNYLDRRFHSLPAGVDVQRFVEFLLEVVQSQSLVVSIPVLVTWTRLLTHRSIGPLIANTSLIGPLLEVCSSRLIRYESLPDDTQDPSYLFLLEDTDTIPERHAFLGNYRRYSSQVIESIVQLKLVDAFHHIFAQAESVLHHLYDDGQPFTAMNYNKNSMPVLRVDAHFTVVEAALKGYMKWRSSKEDSTEKQQQRTALEGEFETWCNRIADLEFEDPCIRKRILQLLVAFSISALDQYPSFMLKVLEHILLTWPSPKEATYRSFNEAIKELQSESMVELQRLATKQPDHLLSVYDQLEAKVKELMASGTLDEKRQVAYQSFLFLIIHRTSQIDQTTRVQRLQGFLAPVQGLWREPELERALSSYSNFCELVGLDKAQMYLARKRIDQVSDWGSIELDAEGLALQADLEVRQTRLPLRSTKTFLNASVERIDRHSDALQASILLWQDALPSILTRLLEFLDHGHASHNFNNWTLLPEEMRPCVGRLLTDRFWQSGISEGSKDDFYARVMERKGTMEGLASSIRSTVRYVRETAYSILCSLSRFSVQFYSFDELPEPLSRALFGNALFLPPHQIIGLLNLVRFLVDNCPVEFREKFLPPLIALCFQQTSSKLVQEWSRIDQQQEVKTDGDALTEEMKAESILRQFGYCAVIMMADFLDPTRANVLLPDSQQQTTSSSTKYPTLRRFCLMNTNLVEPLMVFCNHAIRIHDGRCCSIVLRVLRTIISEFVAVDSALPESIPPPALPPAPMSEGADDDTNGHRSRAESTTTRAPDPFPVPAETSAAVREYLSSEVLKSCILSLHEPYFVDQQREIGSLIASILCHYCPITGTPRQVLLSLPNMKADDVDFAIEQICRAGMQSRQQRALVLGLLKDLKGVSVAEMGKLNKTGGLKRDTFRSAKKSSQRSKMAQEFMTALPTTTGGGGAAGSINNEGVSRSGNARGSPDLEGVAGLFNLVE